MNLSCGNCKTIQNFSGDPPKCDVCGWVYSTDTAYTGMVTIGSFFRVIIVCVVVIVCGRLVDYWLTPEQKRLAG